MLIKSFPENTHWKSIAFNDIVFPLFISNFGKRYKKFE